MTAISAKVLLKAGVWHSIAHVARGEVVSLSAVSTSLVPHWPSPYEGRRVQADVVFYEMASGGSVPQFASLYVGDLHPDVTEAPCVYAAGVARACGEK